MKRNGIIALAFGIAALAYVAPQATNAQTVQESLEHSCQDVRRAFALRQVGTEALAVADPAATVKLRQAALLFYRCAQHELDPYLHQMFLAYYANTLFSVGQNANDAHATTLAAGTAQRLKSSDFDDVVALVSNIHESPTQQQPAPTAAPSPKAHSEAYCRDFVPNVAHSLDALGSALVAASNAGANDTQVLATSTARYGGAFKAVEDDFNSARGSLDDANSALSAANTATSEMNDQEKGAASTTLQAISQTITYTDTYSRLALGFERGINSANRRIAWAKMSQSFASNMRNTSYTYSNGNASCYSYTPYSTNCYGNSYSTTTTDNSAAIAQQNAATALANAEAGRLSYSEADSVLVQGLPLLQQIQSAVWSAQATWDKECPQ